MAGECHGVAGRFFTRYGHWQVLPAAGPQVLLHMQGQHMLCAVHAEHSMCGTSGVAMEQVMGPLWKILHSKAHTRPGGLTPAPRLRPTALLQLSLAAPAPAAPRLPAAAAH